MSGGPLDSRADLRAAIRRLVAALGTNRATVEIERRDLLLVMSLAAARLYERAIGPDLHPGQR